MSTPNIAPPAESLVAFFQDGIETVLICDADPDRRARVKAGFDETSYRFSEPATPDDALRQMRFHDFHVIVVHEEFGAADPADNPVLKHLGQLPMATRRNVFVALLSDRFPTLDAMTANRMSVNLLLNPQELPEVRPILKRALADYRAFYRIHKETRDRLGKS